MGNSIAVYNFKGGVGKTTTSMNLGYSLSRSFKVLLIDCDPQCNLTNALGGPTNTSTIFHYLKHLLHHQTPTRIKPHEVTHYLHLIPGDYALTQIESNNHFITFGDSFIEKLLHLLKRDYDIILLDLPNHFGLLVKSILSHVDSMLIPAIPDSFSIHGIEKLLLYLYKIERDNPLNVLGIFFNLYRENLIHHKKKYEEAVEKFGSLILQTRVNNSIKVSETTDLGKSIIKIDPNNKSAIDFLNLSNEVIGKLDNTFLTAELVAASLSENVHS